MTNLNFDHLKRDFDRDGFIVLKNYLSEEATREMRCHLDHYLENIGPRQHKGGPIGSLKGLDQHDAWFHDYLFAGPHIPLMKHLIGDDLAPDNVTWNDKPKGMDRTFPHFDALGSYRMPPSGISLWIAMDRIDLKNGCLNYERGSHKKEFPMRYPLPDYDENNENAVAIEVEPGDAVMHGAKTVHWSTQPVEDRPRYAMVYVYWGASSAIDPARAAKSTTAAELKKGRTV